MSWGWLLVGYLCLLRLIPATLEGDFGDITSWGFGMVIGLGAFHYLYIDTDLWKTVSPDDDEADRLAP